MVDTKTNNEIDKLLFELNSMSSNFIQQAGDLRKIYGSAVDNIRNNLLQRTVDLAAYVMNETYNMMEQTKSTFVQQDNVTTENQIKNTLDYFKYVEKKEPEEIKRLMQEMYGKVRYRVNKINYQYDKAVYGKPNDDTLQRITNTLRENGEWSRTDDILLKQKFPNSKSIRSFLDIRYLSERTPEEKALLAEYLLRQDLTLLDYMLKPYREIAYPIDNLRFLVARQHTLNNVEKLVQNLEKQIRDVSKLVRDPQNLEFNEEAVKAKINDRRERLNKQMRQAAELNAQEVTLRERLNNLAKEREELMEKSKTKARQIRYLADMSRIIRMYRRLERNFLRNLLSLDQAFLKENTEIPDSHVVKVMTDNRKESDQIIQYTKEFEYYRNMIVSWFKELTSS